MRQPAKRLAAAVCLAMTASAATAAPAVCEKPVYLTLSLIHI